MSYFRSWLVLVLLLCAVNVSAQTTSGSMSGTVVDAQNQVVPGADVIITNEQTQEVRRTVTQRGRRSSRSRAAARSVYRPRRAHRLQADRDSQEHGAGEQPSRASAAAARSRHARRGGHGQRRRRSGRDHADVASGDARPEQVENLSIRGRDPMSLLKILPGVQLLANDNETIGGSFNSPVPSLQGGERTDGLRRRHQRR